MNILQLRQRVIEPTLAFVGDGLRGFASASAVELLLGTIAQESHFRHLAQLGSGPALGFYQIEPPTRRDVHANYLRFRPDLDRRVRQLLAEWPDADTQLITNLAYATAIARLVYWRSPIGLPAPGDVAGHARVWKRVYNTPLGRGTEEEFIRNYQRFVAS